MLKFVTNPAHRAGRAALVTAALLVWTGTSLAHAAEGDRASRMAKFVRPAATPFPSDNPYAPDKAELGRMLFFDPLLSASGTISCATCHIRGWPGATACPRRWARP
jgi:cytochrome c peroxidase